MNTDEARVIVKGNDSVSGFWLFIVSVLAVLTLIVVFVSSDVGWGKPTAQQLVNSVTSDGPEVVFTNGWENCGGSGGHQGGCFNPYTPDKIYVSPDLRYSLMKYIVLHETTHYEQFHAGRELNECEADEQAKEWGADISPSVYYDQCDN